jgi:hypothetical protein
MKRLLVSLATLTLFALAIPQFSVAAAAAVETVDGPRDKWNYSAWGNPKAAV